MRINQLSLALLHLFGAPLPEVFREQVMRPIGASDDWAWRGYDDAWVDLPAAAGRPARRVQSVPGGTHWGGGVSIGARDQARIGQLLLDGGSHGGRQILPAAWVRSMFEPCAIAPFYGRLLWLNRDGRSFPRCVARQRLHGRRRRAPDLDRAGARRGGGAALDEPGAHRGLHAARGGGAAGDVLIQISNVRQRGRILSSWPLPMHNPDRR